MGLNSRLFKGDPALEATLVNDAAHITPGSVGNRVWKIQAALLIINDYVPAILLNELATKRYGPSTTDAVVAFKTKWDIINRAYEKTVDPPEFIGQFPQVRQGIQMHEMGHFHFDFDDFNPDRKSPEECLNSNRSYELLARQVTFGRHEPTS